MRGRRLNGRYGRSEEAIKSKCRANGPRRNTEKLRFCWSCRRAPAREAPGRQFRAPPHRFRLMKSRRANHVLRHGYPDILPLLSRHRFETMPQPITSKTATKQDLLFAPAFK